MAARCVCVLADKVERVDLYFVRDCNYYNLIELTILCRAFITHSPTKLISKIDKSEYYGFQNACMISGMLDAHFSESAHSRRKLV
jgi:hypothetical protein